MIKELKSYLVKFKKDGIMKNKKYLLDYIRKSANQRLVIIIIYNESIFSTNDGI